MVVELMVGRKISVCKDEDEPQQHLRVGEQEDQEDEPFEVELPIGPYAKSIADCKQKIPHSGGNPVDYP